MVRWRHQLDRHELEQTPGDDDGQGGLVCCSPRGRKESDMTEQLNRTESSVPEVVCSHFFEGSSGTVQGEAAYVMATVWLSCS